MFFYNMDFLTAVLSGYNKLQKTQCLYALSCPPAWQEYRRRPVPQSGAVRSRRFFSPAMHALPEQTDKGV